MAKQETLSLIDSFSEFKELKNIDRGTMISVWKSHSEVSSLRRMVLMRTTTLSSILTRVISRYITIEL